MAEEEAAIFEEFKQVAASQAKAPETPAAEEPADEPARAAPTETPTRAAKETPPPVPPRKEKDESARPELG
jgi:hypothetical protein